MTPDQPTETDPLTAIRRHPALVIACALLFGLLGATYALTGPADYVSKTSLIVQDTAAESQASDDPERYVADQVAILQSDIVAERASQLAPTLTPPADLTAGQISRGRTVTSSSESNFVEVQFAAGDPDTARAGANALRLAYEDVVSASRADSAEATITGLDKAIATAVKEVRSLQNRVTRTRGVEDAPHPTDAQIANTVSELPQLRANASAQDGGSGRLAATKQLAQRADQLTSWLSDRLSSDAPLTGPVRRLLRQQRDGVRMLGELTAQRTDAEVEAQLGSNAVAFFTPAGPGRREGMPVTSATLVATVLGALIGAALAYVVSQRSRRIDDPQTAAGVLGVPLLVDVRDPDTGRRRRRRRARNSVTGVVPVLEEPRSEPANNYRTLAAALARRPKDGSAGTNISQLYGAAAKPTSVVACVSATGGDVSAVVALNVALAAGQSGLRVGLVDGDLTGRDVSRRVSELYGHHPAATLAELIDGSVTVDEVAGWIEVRDGAAVSVLSVGADRAALPDVFGSGKVRDVLDRFAEHHDLVVINLPSVLEITQGGAFRAVDKALVIVPHNSSLDDLRELRRRLELMGVRLAGYVYADAAVGADARVEPAPNVVEYTHWETDDEPWTNGEGPHHAPRSETAL
jgi:Mrp family chromosome partitioning ATPase/uncharacterized protein involved in exopolysaccharide biosynthesis